MSTTRKQKKARKSRGLEVLSDIENLDVMLGENQFNGMSREESLDSNSAERPEINNSFRNEDDNSYIIKISVQGSMLIAASIQLKLALTLRLIGCLVN